MHRARVNTVAGNKALVEGKWLTVIGNRSVHNGDWVWTDGRCIYGHESIGGGTPVLAKCGERGIPLYVGLKHYIYQREELQKLYGSYERRGLLYRGTHAAHFLPYFPKSREGWLLDADMDAAGNVFTLTGPYRCDGYAISQNIVYARENGKEIASFDISAYYGRYAEIAATTGGGHIDCEGNWSFFLEIDAQSVKDDYSTKPWVPGMEAVSTMYYVDAKNVYSLLHEHIYVNAKGIIQPITIAAGGGTLKFPIHDGYYYVWDACSPMGPNWFHLSTYVMMTIYTPDDKAILTDYFYPATRFTIYYLGRGQYLLGVYATNMQMIQGFTAGEHAIPWTMPPEWESVSAVRGGLYRCKDGMLQKLADGDCDTFRFRYVRGIKDWKKTLARLYREVR